MTPELRQQRRADLEFIGALSTFAGGVLRPAARRQFAEADVADPGDLAGRRQVVDQVIGDSPVWQLDRFLARWVAEQQWVVGRQAVEDHRQDFEAWLDVPDEVPGALRLDPDLVPPDYWTTEFHLTPGGWDGHDLQACMISDIVYPYVIIPAGVGGARTGENVLDQRRQTAQQAPRSRYRRILDLGTGTGRFARSLQQEYPDAEVVGVDLSATALRRARAIARDHGWAWELVQAPAESTGLPDASFDLVGFYVLFHEVPRHAGKAILAEAYRLLEPGGDVLIGDLAPYARQDAFSTVMLDWETEYRNEPFWRGAMQHDLTEVLASVGFVDIDAYGIGDHDYPWIVRARRPEEELA